MGLHDDKTEQPTAKKRKDVRKKGQVAKSPKISGWAAVLVGTFAIPPMIGKAWAASHQALEATTHLGPGSEASDATLIAGRSFGAVITIAAPMMAAICLTVIVVDAVQTRGLVAPSVLKPKFGKLNPLKGIKNLVSVQALWRIVLMLAETIVLTLVAWGPVSGLARLMTSAQRPDVAAMPALVGGTALDIARRVAAIGLLLALADYAVQYRKHRSQIKMTKQEVKEEYKSQEGNPQIKGKIRQQMLAVSRNRMIAMVSKSKVVVVNPTHVAVALGYEQGERAPRVIAKGRGPLAQRIREEAEKHNVPIVRDVPLARTLESACEVGDEIPQKLYEAVARLLAFVFMLGRRGARFGGAVTMPIPASSALSPEDRVAAETLQPVRRRPRGKGARPAPVAAGASSGSVVPIT